MITNKYLYTHSKYHADVHGKHAQVLWNFYLVMKIVKLLSRLSCKELQIVRLVNRTLKVVRVSYKPSGILAALAWYGLRPSVYKICRLSGTCISLCSKKTGE